jgi:hypothetical protein
MSTNRVRTNSRLLADIVLNPRSRAYKDLLEMSWDNETQSDASAAQLRDELKSTLIDLLQAQNLDVVNEKLAKAPAAPPAVVRLRVSEPTTGVPADDIRLGKHRLFVRRAIIGATAEELVYGVLRRALESKDIERLALCEQCGKLFYRGKSLKRSFCSNQCRWDFHNRSERRKRQRIGGVWIKKKDLR